MATNAMALLTAAAHGDTLTSALLLQEALDGGRQDVAVDLMAELVGVGSVLVKELAGHLRVEPSMLLQEIALRIAR